MELKKERLWQHIQELSRIGRQQDGSITRFPFTKEDQQARDLLLVWMREAGLETCVDAAGNVIGTLLGEDPTLTPVACGSHYDTVRCGGAFDGCLGVLGGIEALQSIKEAGIPIKRSLKVIAFKDEEGNRFGYGMIGSKAICGLVEAEGFASLDEQGISLYDAMKDAGYTPELVDACKLNLHAFIELHIEQAKVLEEHGCSVGIVSGIAGLARYTIHIKGESAHAGATPMLQRRDPVVAMAAWISRITDLAKSYPGCVATIGQIETIPGSCNVICDHVTLSLDIRSLVMEDVQTVMTKMEQFHQELTQAYGVAITMVKEEELSPALCNPQLQKQLAVCCERRGLAYETLVSGAGHDSMNFKEVCPMAMIFVRSENGYSHRKEEYSSREDCANGTALLLDMLCHCAGYTQDQ